MSLLLSRCCGVAGDGEEELGCWLTREKEHRVAPSGRENCTVGERERELQRAEEGERETLLEEREKGCETEKSREKHAEKRGELQWG